MSIIDAITEKARLWDLNRHKKLPWFAVLTHDELQWMQDHGWEISGFGEYLLSHSPEPKWSKHEISFKPPEEIEILWRLCQ
jgi:hypothetical protein